MANYKSGYTVVKLASGKYGLKTYLGFAVVDTDMQPREYPTKRAAEQEAKVLQERLEGHVQKFVSGKK